LKCFRFLVEFKNMSKSSWGAKTGGTRWDIATTKEKEGESLASSLIIE